MNFIEITQQNLIFTVKITPNILIFRVVEYVTKFILDLLKTSNDTASIDDKLLWKANSMKMIKFVAIQNLRF